jgi:hypothetical protein
MSTVRSAQIGPRGWYNSAGWDSDTLFLFLSQGDLGGWLVVPLVAVGGGGWPVGVGVGVGSQNSQASQLNEAS